MLKEEFEKMIGKEVEWETYELYNTMYTALPDNIDKQQFVAMLNIDRIPESEASKQRRKEKAQLIARIQSEIEYNKSLIKQNEEQIEKYKQWVAEAITEESRKEFKTWAKEYRKQNERYRAQIRELKQVIAA